MTLTARVLATVQAFPGETAYQIALILADPNRYTAISSILAKLTVRGRVLRRMGMSARGPYETSWRYYPVRGSQE